MTDILSNIQSVSVKITSITGDQVDVTQFFTAINIYQSLINRRFMNGRVVLADTADLLSNLPIIGGEIVNISIQNSYDSEFANYEFKIYKVDRDTNTFKSIKKLKILNIYLCSTEELNNYTKISKKYTGTGTSIVQSLVTTNLQSSKTLSTIADTSNLEFVSNFWTVEECLKYIENNTSGTYFDYIFYENNSGYHFKPLSSLFALSNTATYKFDLQTEQFINIDNILQYQFDNHFDDLIWRKKGLFGSTGYKISDDLYQADFLSETISDIDSKIFHNGTNRTYNNDRDALNRIYVTYEDDVVNLVRTTHLNLLNRYNFVCQFNGDMGRNVGDMVEIIFPSIDNESATGSDSFSGNWITSEINTTIFQDNSLKQNITFAKNALFNNFKLPRY